MGLQAMSLGLGSEVAIRRGGGLEDVISQGLEESPPGQTGPAGASLAFRGQACLGLVSRPAPLLEKASSGPHRISPSGGLQGPYRGILPPDIGRRLALELERESCPIAHLTAGSQRRRINATLGSRILSPPLYRNYRGSLPHIKAASRNE